MQLDELKGMLKAWGHATVNRFAFSKAERTTHQLARVAQDKPMPKEQADRRLIERSGYTRRLRMAESVRIKGVRCVPLWACEPIPARNDADAPHDNAEAAVDMGIPDDLRWLEAAVTRIERQNPLRGRVLRTEYTVSGSQEMKARLIAEGYGGKFTTPMYRSELAKVHELLLWELQRAA